MNETERMNETNLFETESAPMTASAPLCANDSANEIANGNASESATLSAENTPAESTTVSAEDEAPGSFFERAIDLFYTVWDGFLDLLVALHILEEALPEEVTTASEVPSAPEAPSAPGSGLFPAEQSRPNGHLPITSAALHAPAAS